MKAGEQRRLAITSSTADVRVIAGFSREAVSESFSEKEITPIEVAVVEAANNIVKHSYGFEEGHPIELTINHSGDEIEFNFRDEGPKFDTSKIRLPKFDWDKIDEIPENGRGIYMMNEIMNQVEYKRDGNFNLLRMTKKVTISTNRDPLPLLPDSSPSTKEIDKLKEDMEVNEMAINEMAEELSVAYESLNLFYSLSKDVALISDLDSFLENTLEKALSVANGDWGVVRLKKGNSLILSSGTENCPDIAKTKNITINDSGSIEGKVTFSLQKEIQDNYGDLEVHVLCLPIVGLDEFLGTILLGKSKSKAPFASGDAKLTRAMADQIAVSIENSRLYTKAMDVELAEKEMEIATNLQKKLILEKLPTMPELKFYIRSEPAKQVGGDYLTLYKVNDNILYLAVCDAMGKGMSASYFSLLSHMALHSIIIQQDSKQMTPGELLTLVNKVMGSDFDLFGMFMTAFVGKINLEKNTLEYASAGHCQPIIYTPSKGVDLLETSDFMLGVERETEYSDFKVDFKSETKLLVYSDGLTDITDPSGEMVGAEPLAKACAIEFKENNIVDSCEKIYQAILTMSEGILQDDISMIGVEREKLQNAVVREGQQA